MYLLHSIEKRFGKKKNPWKKNLLVQNLDRLDEYYKTLIVNGWQPLK